MKGQGGNSLCFWPVKSPACPLQPPDGENVHDGFHRVAKKKRRMVKREVDRWSSRSIARFFFIELSFLNDYFAFG